ncbi:MAG: class I SAM-dependent methyltransferase [Aliishimia sp.]
MSARLTLAVASGVAPSEAGQSVLVLGANADVDLSAFEPANVTVVQDMMPDAKMLAQHGVNVVQSLPEGPFDATFVCLPRSKEAARGRIQAAMAVTSGLVFVDGQKTDGVESFLKDMRKRTDVLGSLSKSHGKLFWCEACPDFSDWKEVPNVVEDRWHTVPGVFSANSVDPGSALLTQHVPENMSGKIADLGAGWGYVSGRLLERCPKISTLHLVEAQASALSCARNNVTDPRASFHWDDATVWAGAKALDAVVMNPPFHAGRAAEPELGRAFITSAARLLRPGGKLWMVANRHLPYEQTLREHFVDVAEIAGDSRFKVLHAKAKSRAKR